MRNFSWKYFAMTGDVDAYLLYKETDGERVLAAASAEDEAAQHEEDE
ncbi:MULTISPECIES: YqzL family protein [Paenibacillus]|uniref:YqzL family protein n=1 Tax=Paenibacillus lactis TaxID=228574 RepID=A0ABS4FGH0_9BACL|nr:YqzL family protein [Paenibacillus lactis]MBP1895157.1 hypothetical protein [Paenibacillus lactis]MCM3495606.1 YqzL family protein [Paenibacillus lactis]GIO90546.1 hypothetical protein J31TS3_17730 [Paenibacillus lactis]HAF99851.1 YqzL family protein [Paenibacillus lactis]